MPLSSVLGPIVGEFKERYGESCSKKAFSTVRRKDDRILRVGMLYDCLLANNPDPKYRTPKYLRRHDCGLADVRGVLDALVDACQETPEVVTSAGLYINDPMLSEALGAHPDLTIEFSMEKTDVSHTDAGFCRYFRELLPDSF